MKVTWVVVTFVCCFVLGWGLVLLAQPPGAMLFPEPVAPGVPPGGMLGWMFTFAILANGIMKRMKTYAWFPVIAQGAGRINVAMAGLLAAGAAIGIHTTFDAGTLTITGLTLSSVCHVGGEWVRQWALQQFTYQAMRSEY